MVVFDLLNLPVCCAGQAGYRFLVIIEEGLQEGLVVYNWGLGDLGSLCVVVLLLLYLLSVEGFELFKSGNFL